MILRFNKTGLKHLAMVLAAASTALFACGDDGATTEGAGGSGGATTSSTTATNGGSGGTGGMMGCEGGAPVAPMQCVESVTGRVVDDQGMGVPNLVVTVCGTVACNPGETEADGTFEVAVNSNINAADFSVIPHGRADDKSTFYFALPTDQLGTEIVYGDVLVYDMPTTGGTFVTQQDGMGPVAQVLSDNGVSLDVPQGTFVQVGFEDISAGNIRFVAKDVPAADIDTFAPGESLVALWAFYPFEAVFRPDGSPLGFDKVPITVPNATGLPAGSAVEFLSHGSFIFPTVVPAATFAVVATGTVSQDGMTISCDAGEGLEVLTWVGIRPAP